MKKFTRFCMALAGISILIGLIFCIAAFVLGINNKEFKEALHAGHFSIGFLQNDGSKECESVSFEKDTISNLNLDIGAGEIHVETYSGSEYKAEYVPAYTECYEQNGTLFIKEKSHGFHFFWFSFDENISEVTLYIPEDAVLEEAHISVGAGEADVTGLEAEKLYLETGAGEIIARDMKGNRKTILDNGVGSMTVTNLVTGDAEFSTGVGEIEVEATVSGDITADCGVGEMKLDLENREMDFNYDISCDVGDISINGFSYSGLSQNHKTNNSAKQEFKVDCGVGSIDINLKEE